MCSSGRPGARGPAAGNAEGPRTGSPTAGSSAPGQREGVTGRGRGRERENETRQYAELSYNNEIVEHIFDPTRMSLSTPVSPLWPRHLSTRDEEKVAVQIAPEVM